MFSLLHFAGSQSGSTPEINSSVSYSSLKTESLETQLQIALVVKYGLRLQPSATTLGLSATKNASPAAVVFTAASTGIDARGVCRSCWRGLGTTI